MRLTPFTDYEQPAAMLNVAVRTSRRAAEPGIYLACLPDRTNFGAIKSENDTIPSLSKLAGYGKRSSSYTGEEPCVYGMPQECGCDHGPGRGMMGRPA
jgi:hypothetical protein